MPGLEDLLAKGRDWFDAYSKWRDGGTNPLEQLGRAFPQDTGLSGGRVQDVAPPPTSLSPEQWEAIPNWGATQAGPTAEGLAALAPRASKPMLKQALGAASPDLPPGTGAWAIRKAAEERLNPDNPAPDWVKGATMSDPGMLDVPAGSIITHDPAALARTPDVPQFGLQRMAPPAKGVPAKIQAIADPARIPGYDAAVAKGRELGAEGWYNTEPLRQRFRQELGDAAGDRAFGRFLTMFAGTSVQTPVPMNFKNASLLHSMDMQGLGVPLARPNVPGYIMMDMHPAGVRKALERGGFDPVQNPKLASFEQNLGGNWTPATIDTHMMKFFGLPESAPNQNVYKYIEDFTQQQAARHGLTPAQYQAAGWFDASGLRSPQEPWMATLERKLAFTALARGEHPQDTLRSFIRGKAPLLGLGAGIGAYALPRDDGRS